MRWADLLLGLLTLFFTAPSFSVEVNIPQKSPPAGVKRIITYDLSESGEKRTVSSIRYDQYGNITTEEIFEENGDLQWTVLYHYNDDFQILEKKAVGPEEKQVWRSSYTYDDGTGRIEKEVNHNRHDQTDYTKVYEYSGNEVDTLMYGPDGAVRWRKSAIYTDDGKTKRLYYYYSDGNRIKGIIREYNALGKVTVERHIDEIGTVFRRIETEYDELGRVVGRRIYNDRGEIHRRVWIDYLDNGHIHRVRHIVPSERREEEYLYDYETDSRGAWVRKEEILRITIGEEREKIVRRTLQSREIEYFPYSTGEIE